MSYLGMGRYLLESDWLMFEGVLAELLSILCEFQVHTPGQKAKAKKMRFWKIYGYNGLTKIYGRELKTGCFSEKEIQAVLKSLVAKAGLDFDDIVGAYAKRKTNIATNLLEVRKDGPQPRFMCGDNPYFTARVIEK